MSISSVSSVTDSGQAAKIKNEKYSDLGKSDFLELMAAQLKYQDPLSPVSNFDFLSQAAQFSLLEQVASLNSRFDVLTQIYDMTYANSFLNKVIEWEDEEGNINISTVDKIERKDGVVWLCSENNYIAPSWVKSISVSEKNNNQNEENLI
ncbi:MAG: flagellar hook capping FlgD N-terminal domain-containing protein [Actinomycetota bacterium]|nr:flagellar hook capping FlgD N-terminal domain-containing protein [Actinomycetota bacterium]